MDTYFFEATNGFNWGKFCVGIFTSEEWARQTHMPSAHGPLLTNLGWHPSRPHAWVMDLQTGEAAYFQWGGSARADLNGKHHIWVCPLFEPVLVWLYEQDLNKLGELCQDVIQLTEDEAPSSLHGHRRRGGT